MTLPMVGVATLGVLRVAVMVSKEASKSEVEPSLRLLEEIRLRSRAGGLGVVRPDGSAEAATAPPGPPDPCASWSNLNGSTGLIRFPSGVGLHSGACSNNPS